MLFNNFLHNLKFVKTNKKLFLLFILTTLVLPLFALAQSAQVQWFTDILLRISYVLWAVFTGLVVIMFVITGIMYLLARGEAGKIQTANKTLFWSIIGVGVSILAYSAYTIVNWVIFG